MENKTKYYSDIVKLAYCNCYGSTSYKSGNFYDLLHS